MIKTCKIDGSYCTSVEVKETPKTITIEFLEDGVEYHSWYKKGDVLKCKKDNMSNHCIREWSDGTYTIYPNRGGVPYYIQ